MTVRGKLPILLLLLTLLWGCNGKMNRRGVDILLQQAIQAYEQGHCTASLRLLDSVPQCTDNQFQLLQADLLAMRIYITTAANEDFCRSRNSAIMRMQMIREEQSTLSPERLQRLDSLRLTFHLYSCLYYRNVHFVERASGELVDIRSLEALCPDTALRIRSRLVSAGDSVSLRDYISWCRDNNRWSLEGELLMHEARYALTEADTLTALLDAEQAGQLFYQVGNPFLQAGSLCYLAHLYTGADAPAVAVEYLEEALALLDTCNRADTLSSPLPLLASIREELSVAYGAMGEKRLSDYNRNIYLDILDLTRQDKETESRYEQLQQVHRMNLYMLLGITLLMLILVTSLFLFHRLWNRRARRAAARMESTSRYCHALLSDEPMERPEEVIQPLAEPYEQWAGSRRESMELMEEQRTELEEQRAVLLSKKSASLEKNIEKRSLVGVLEVMMPGIERLCHTVGRLRTGETTRENRGELLAYARELSDCIYDYNEILGDWIKLQRGEVALRIETFPLQQVFDEIARARERYECEGLTLNVLPTQVRVKADNALTFFMLNTLSENARKFTPQGGEVTVSVTGATDAYVEISVADTGVGISQEDVETLLNEKVYDSSRVGQGTVDKSKKGHGFGIMNCKGIIHKYLKSGSLFSVCTFGVESTPGRGSRFYFRLPRVLVWVGILLGAWSSVRAAEPSLKQRIEMLTDSCYYSNIRGTYGQTILFADSALTLYNRETERLLGRPLHTGEALVLQGKDHEAAFETGAGVRVQGIDYAPLLSIRNEVAVAALALRNLPLYAYNNEVYQDLYHLLSQDRQLDDTCERLDGSNHNIHVWSILMLLILFAIPVAYYFLLIHGRMLYRFEVARMMEINRRILSLATREQELETLLEGILEAFSGLTDVQGIALYIPASGSRKRMFLVRGMGVSAESLEGRLEACVERGSEELSEGLCCFPLVAFGTCVGGVALRFEKEPSQHLQNVLRDNTLELLSHLLYHALMHHRDSVEDVESLRGSVSQLSYEEYRLYTENMVLDNCLSAVKHETMYYPALVRRMLQQRTELPTHEEVQSLYETVDYYRRVFTILCTRAHGQMEYGMLRPVPLTAAWVEKEVQRVCRVCNRKRGASVQVSVQNNVEGAFLGDSACVAHLLRLCVEVLHGVCEGELSLRIEPYQRLTRIALGTFRGRWEQGELDKLFYPHREHIPYLIMRQIVRLHDDYFDYRGCRIVAQSRVGGGFEIWFTLVDDEYGKI